MRSGIDPVLWLSFSSSAGLILPWAVSSPTPSLNSAVTWWLSTAPSAATPIEPPVERKNATTELADPMSSARALFCTARTRFCIVAPRPTPTTAM